MEMREYRDRVISKSRSMKHSQCDKKTSVKEPEAKEEKVKAHVSEQLVNKVKSLKLLHLMVSHPEWAGHVDTHNATDIKV